MTTPTSTAMLSIPDLRAAIAGRVITPDDPDYDAVRRVSLGSFDDRPAVIVRVANAADVATAIATSRATGLELAVRCGGHSAAGHSTVDGGLVIDVSGMKALGIDVDGRTAWAEAGLTAGEYTTATGAHGLVTGFGDTGSVGVAGITLGGGIGYLVRKYGMTIDNLLAAEIVTADGKLLRVDAENHPDLFWAIRGGGGNFGVATRFRFQLHDVSAFTGGMMVLPATAEIVAGFIAAAAAAPDELSTIANVMPCPPLPFVSQEHHGELVIFAILGCVGEPEAAAAAIAPLRALATPLADMVQPMPYAAIYPPEDPEYRPKAVATTLFVDHVDLDTAALIMDRLAASDATMRACQLRVLGGAMARVPADATAFAHRGSRILVNVAAFYEGPEDQEVRERWVADFHRDLEGDDTGAYVNFVANEGEARVRAAYPGSTWDRLREVKRRYDPDNVFRRNQNVPPATV
ncbi:MAG: FAD-binding oxidoreductase [Chloroflexota bacterium]